MNRILIPSHDKSMRIDEVLRKFRGKKWLSSTDIASGYFNVKLIEDSRQYTAFSVNGIQYRYQVLPFGLKVSSQIFIKSLDECLSNVTKMNSAV